MLSQHDPQAVHASQQTARVRSYTVNVRCRKGIRQRLMRKAWCQATEDDEQQPLVYTSQQQQQGSARNTQPQQADKGSSGAQAYHQVAQETTSQQRPGVLYQVPWDIWDFIQVTAAIWVINMAIPYAVLSSFAQLQGSNIPGIPPQQRELLNLFCQLLQLGSTFFIINTYTKKHQPLPTPWFLVEFGTIPIFQGLATAIAAVGSGVLLSGFMTGHVDGAEEWRHLAGLHQDDVGSVALVAGALVLAPAVEEYYFRGYVLPSLTRWVNPVIAVPLTGVLFASAHPAESFLPEALLGTILSLSLLAADGNLLVPLLAHSMYNAFVLGTEYLL